MGLSVTASKAQLLAACRYPFRSDVEVPYEPMSPAAEEGRRRHAEIEAYIHGRPSEVPQDSGLAEYIARDGRSWRTEVGYAVMPDLSTVATAPRGERGYKRVRGAWTHGTADAVSSEQDEALPLVVDWKTGRSPAPPSYQNAQLFLGAHALTGGPRVIVAIVTVDEAWNVRVDETTMERGLVREHVADLYDRARTVEGAEPEPGPHCAGLYCPLRAVCPAGRAAASELAATAATDLADVETLRRLVRSLPLVEERAKAVRAAADAYVSQHGPLELGDGYAYRETTRTRRAVEVTDRAVAIIRAHDDDAAIATTVRVGALSKPTLAALDAAGLVSVSTSTTNQITKG